MLQLKENRLSEIESVDMLCNCCNKGTVFYYKESTVSYKKESYNREDIYECEYCKNKFKVKPTRRLF